MGCFSLECMQCQNDEYYGLWAWHLLQVFQGMISRITEIILQNGRDAAEFHKQGLIYHRSLFLSLCLPLFAYHLNSLSLRTGFLHKVRNMITKAAVLPHSRVPVVTENDYIFQFQLGKLIQGKNSDWLIQISGPINCDQRAGSYKLMAVSTRATWLEQEEVQVSVEGRGGRLKKQKISVM